jgi:hypothetical protein
MLTEWLDPRHARPAKRYRFLAKFTTLSGLDISQGTEANGRGALSDWACALKNSFHVFHLPRPCAAEMALKMGVQQFSYVKPCSVNVTEERIAFEKYDFLVGGGNFCTFSCSCSKSK